MTIVPDLQLSRSIPVTDPAVAGAWRTCTVCGQPIVGSAARHSTCGPIVLLVESAPNPHPAAVDEAPAPRCPVTGESVWADPGCRDDCWMACASAEVAS